MTKSEIAQAIAHDYQTEERVEMIASIRDKSRTQWAKGATLERKAQRRFKSIIQGR